MPGKPRKAASAVHENSSKKKWLPRLFLYGAFVFVGYQIFALLFGSSISGLGSSSMFGLGSVLHTGVSSSDGKGAVTGLPLTTDGYNKLIEYDQTIQLTADQKKQYAGFNLFIPCCGFKFTTEDENNDCRCGHHIADAGLIKYGITNGFTRDQIQAELDQWKPIFYPICNERPELCDLQ